MVYIYRKTIGNKQYYYLRASQKKGPKVMVKDIAYLGSSLTEVKKALDSLPQYSDQIRKAYKTINHFLESNRYLDKIKELKLKSDSFLGERILRIEACRLHYFQEFQKSPELTKKEVFNNFMVEFAFNTTSIEGNTINLNEARNLLQEGYTPKNKTLREIYDLQNTEKVWLWLINCKEEISHDLIIKVHLELMENIDPRKGDYRINDVRVIHSNFEATPAPYVKTDMGLLLKWYDKNKEKMHPLVLATIFHHKFEKIHPFFDGNGRTGRMILNYILLKNNYPPLIIHKKSRMKYLEAMRSADLSELEETDQKKYKKLIDFISQEMVETYWGTFL